MKIHFITTSYPLHEGHMAGHFVKALADRLADRGHTLQVWAPNDGQSPNTRSEGQVTVHRFDYAPFRKPKKLVYGNGILPNLKAHPLAAFELPTFLRALKHAGIVASRACDLVHAHWTISALGVPTAHPLVVSARGSDLSGAGGGLMQGFSKKIIRRASAVIAENNQLAATARLECPQVFTLGNGVDLDAYRPNPDAAPFAHSPLANRSTVFLFVGRLSEVKGADLFLAALKKLPHELDWAAVVVGNGPLRPAFESAGLGDRLLLTGELPTEQVIPYYQATDALVVSSRYEGRPNNVMEAQACGLPVITFPLPGVVEMIHSGINGLVTAEHTAESLGNALTDFLQSPSTGADLRTASRAWAETHLDWEKIVDEYERVYHVAQAK